MEDKYIWNVIGDGLKLNLTQNGKLTAHYKREYGTVFYQLNIFDHYDSEKIAEITTYKELPDLIGLNVGAAHIRKYFGQIKSADIPEHKSSKGLKELLELIETEVVNSPQPCQ